MSLTPEQRDQLQAQEKELDTWVQGYRKDITRRLARPRPRPDTETLQLMDLALQKSRTLNSIRWHLFIDRYPNAGETC